MYVIPFGGILVFLSMVNFIAFGFIYWFHLLVSLSGHLWYIVVILVLFAGILEYAVYLMPPRKVYFVHQWETLLDKRRKCLILCVWIRK